jgi:hypothetical protein
MAARYYRLALDVARPAPEVFARVFDLENHQAVHPLVVSMTRTSESRNEAGQWVRTYVVVDRILGVRFSYDVTQWQVGPLCFESRSVAPGGLELHSRWMVEPVGDTCTLAETVSLSGSLATIDFAVWQAKRAHRQVMAAFKASLEARGA